MRYRKAGVVLIAVIVFWGGQQLMPIGTESEIRAEEKKDEPFLKILHMAYQVSCQDAESLKDYYFQDAEIIHDGRQMTLNETIQELERTVSSVTELSCHYQPKIRASRHGKKMAYLVVRETIRFTAHEMDSVLLQQICTYVFLKKQSNWKISHDHCSSISGMSI